MADTTALPPSTRTWDGAAAAGAAGLVKRFEAAWRASKPGARPDPSAFLPGDSPERPAALLALARADIALRWESGDRRTVESYRAAFPDLDDDAQVALAYEEFCLREELGDAPDPFEYDERFPELAAKLRRVFDIHELVGSGGSAAFRATAASDPAFPESGQTTAGFRLIEELGRGSFARVFLAEERQLADRPVALKVSRTGNREPQTLARLQHTHIVPVHSTRTDPATGLHLLCMPYFGRVTLERLLAEPAVKTARTGADVLQALDALDPAAPSEATTARKLFARLPYARAMAWWGARMAEALAHAHERGVLHRDIKPSNVLVTADGLPMLLDFNLARDPRAEAAGPSLGGTLAYMSPEHLDAIAGGSDDGVDHRADVYSLGVLLYETLTGRRPFETPAGAATVGEAIARAVEARRTIRPAIRESHPEIPAAMEAVVLKCLAVDPARRYATAEALAVDLQAVADDAPLRQASEPIVSRVLRFTRRRRWPMLMLGVVAVAWLFLASALWHAKDDQRRLAAQLSTWIDEGSSLMRAGRHAEAAVKFRDASSLARNTPNYERQPPLLQRLDQAQRGLLDAERSILIAHRGDAVVALARTLRTRPGAAADLPALDAALAPWLDPQAPATADPLVRLGVEFLLFERALILSRIGTLASRRDALAACGLAARFGDDRTAWGLLQASLASGRGVEFPSPSTVSSPSTALLLARLAETRGDRPLASSFYRRALTLAPVLVDLKDVMGRLARD